MKQKETLIVIPGFANNSIFLQEVIIYLGKFFNVYCIDLPGFIKEYQPFPKPSIDDFVEHVEKKILELSLTDYYLVGISFGYAVINRLHLNKNCKGILAIYPYLSESYLKFGILKKIFLKITLFIIKKFQLEVFLWRSEIFKIFLKFIGNDDKDIKDTLNQIDAKTYFSAAEFILENNKKINMPNLPHVVILSNRDEILDYKRLLKTFKEAAKKLILTTSLPHMPKKLTQSIIELHFPPSLIAQMRVFLNQAK